MTATTETTMTAAALKFAKSIGVKGAGLVALRVTGTAGLSGIFQCYESVKGGGQSSTGPNIHVMECAGADGVKCSKRA